MDAPKDVKVNPSLFPYSFTNYAAAADGSVKGNNPDWYWEVFFPEQFTPVPDYAAQVVIDQNNVIQQYGITAITHFHSPSEHTVDGKHYDLELHFGFARYDCFISPPGANCAFGNLTVFFDRSAAVNDADNDFIASYQAAYADRNNSNAATKKGIDYSLLTEKPGLLS